MSENKKLSIVQVNAADLGGGAERVSNMLHREYKSYGYMSKLVVGRKRINDNDIIVVDNRNRTKGFGILKIAEEKFLGHQYLHYPGSYDIADSMASQVDVVHLHNLHGGYFDLEALPQISKIAPLIFSLHDNWLFTGHCGYFLDCNRWKNGCGRCPYLAMPPAIKIDGTRFNWLRKREILSSLPMMITAPSQWMLDQVSESFLSHHPRRLIYNGVEQSIFNRGDKIHARKKLGLPVDAKIVLFCATGGLTNEFKDGLTLVQAMQILVNRNVENDRKLLLVSVGGGIKRPNGFKKGIRNVARLLLRLENEEDIVMSAGLVDSTICVGNVTDPFRMADYYRAADVLTYTSKADNCPLTILEALSCGLPVVGSRVGGIPELIVEGKTGYTVRPKDPLALAEILGRILKDDAMIDSLSFEAQKYSRGRFDISRLAKNFIELYEEAIEISAR